LLVVPLNGESPEVAKAFTALTKDVSTTGIALVADRSIRIAAAFFLRSSCACSDVIACDWKPRWIRLDLRDDRGESASRSKLNPCYANGCQPASAHSSPLTAEFSIMKQMAWAISWGWIRRCNCVWGKMRSRMYSSPRPRTIGVSV
jgi:hypothetical protein